MTDVDEEFILVFISSDELLDMIACRYYAASGVCFYGDECKFAHGNTNAAAVAANNVDATDSEAFTAGNAALMPEPLPLPSPSPLADSALKQFADDDPLPMSISGPPFDPNRREKVRGVFERGSSALRRRAIANAEARHSAPSNDTTPLTALRGRFRMIRALKQTVVHTRNAATRIAAVTVSEFAAVDAIDGADCRIVVVPIQTHALTANTQRTIRRWRRLALDEDGRDNDDDDSGDEYTSAPSPSSAVARLRKVFSSNEFADGAAVVAVYDYAPAHERLSVTRGERALWNVVCQMIQALTAVHAAGLTFNGALDADTVVIVGAPDRIHLLNGGLAEIISGDDFAALPQRQSDDVAALGKLILSITTNNDDVGAALAAMSKTSSPDLCHLTAQFISRTAPPLKSLIFIPAIAQRVVAYQNELIAHVNDVEAVAQREIDNGRLFRLLLKLNFLDRASLTAWNDTGERYLLELFRRLIFDSTIAAPHHNNNVDIAFAVDQLNKVDAGSLEKVILSGNDGESVLIVRYADIKRAIDRAAAQTIQSAIVTATRLGAPS